MTDQPTGLRERILGARLIQPDQRTCGPAALVVSRMLSHPEYAATVLERGSFATEVLALHRRAGRVLSDGRPQVPWPGALGTAPWAAARLMTRGCGVAGARYRARLIGRRRQTCFVVIPGKKPPAAAAPAPAHVTPWYEKLWGSVRDANQATTP